MKKTFDKAIGGILAGNVGGGHKEGATHAEGYNAETVTSDETIEIGWVKMARPERFELPTF
jgi:hypothetical protein